MFECCCYIYIQSLIGRKLSYSCVSKVTWVRAYSSKSYSRIGSAKWSAIVSHLRGLVPRWQWLTTRISPVAQETSWNDVSSASFFNSGSWELSSWHKSCRFDCTVPVAGHLNMDQGLLETMSVAQFDIVANKLWYTFRCRE